MEKFSQNFKKLFLLYFTKELIMHSASGEMIQLQTLMKDQIKEGKKEFVHSIKRGLSEIGELKQEKIKERQEKFVHSIKKNISKREEKRELEHKDLDFSHVFKKMEPRFAPRPRTLIIPEPKLPPHLQYLKPVPRDIKIDLEKLNPLIKDPAVKIIECNGPDEHILVRGSMGTKPTGIVLSKEETNSIIKTFSDITKIPVHEGVYRVVAGRLILSAIISDVIGSKFMIKKMLYAPTFQKRTYPQPMIK